MDHLIAPSATDTDNWRIMNSRECGRKRVFVLEALFWPFGKEHEILEQKVFRLAFETRTLPIEDISTTVCVYLLMLSLTRNTSLMTGE
jgi:hypothetical protein